MSAFEVIAPRSDQVVGISRGAQVTGIVVCSLSLTWISVGLRCYVRTRILRFFGREDYLTLVALAIFTILCSLCQRTVKYGLGAHMHNIDPGYLQIASKYIFICELLYVATTAMTKVAIGFYFLRLSGKRYQAYITYAVMTIALFFSTIYFFFLLFQCRPVSYLWSQFDHQSGTCLGTNILANVTYAHAAMSAVTDWAFGILPISFVWNMKMSQRTKLSVILILSLGFFASTATIVRIVYIRSLTRTTDYSWEGINLVKWSMVEPAIGITAAAIATLRPLFKSFTVQPRLPTAYSSGTLSDGKRSAESLPNGEEYSEEFADMLGLRRVGVTTVISADVLELKNNREKRSWRRKGKKKMGNPEFSDSVTHLHDGEGQKEGGGGFLDLNEGIMTTTVITIEQ